VSLVYAVRRSMVLMNITGHGTRVYFLNYIEKLPTITPHQMLEYFEVISQREQICRTVSKINFRQMKRNKPTYISDLTNRNFD
jgi:hypothetical protein